MFRREKHQPIMIDVVVIRTEDGKNAEETQGEGKSCLSHTVQCWGLSESARTLRACR